MTPDRLALATILATLAWAPICGRLCDHIRNHNKEHTS